MKNIGFSMLWKGYDSDRLFDVSACKLSDNIFYPYIALKNRLEQMGYCCHTADLFRLGEVDAYIFMDIPTQSILVRHSALNVLKYLATFRWRKDFLLHAVLRKKPCYLLILEPPVVVPLSYAKKYHKYFDKIFTWSDYALEGAPYVRLPVPETLPAPLAYTVPFCEKKFLTLIASNKLCDYSAEEYRRRNIAIDFCDYSTELYSRRREVVDYFENTDGVFDLYGFGWEKEHLKNYRGCVDSKRDTLAKYKFCICFENCSGINGYITEKIFDCFFAKSIPIYWGADDITQWIPAETFIDMRSFSSIDAMYAHLLTITQEQYEAYLRAAEDFLNSQSFKEHFSIDSYVSTLVTTLLPNNPNP